MNYLHPTKSPVALPFRALLCLALVVLAFPGLGQTRPASGVQTNRPPSDRYLVILEISAAMEQRAPNVQRVLGQLFSTSLNGQLRRGDTIGIWTYNNELHTGEFPLQRWSPQSIRETTTAIVLFAQKQNHSKQSRLAPVMAQLTNVVADSDKLTVILISDGSEALTGTPFDAQIAAAFKLNAAEQRKQSMPFVTVLRAVKGEFVSFKVNAPPWAIELPAFPAEPAPVAPPPTNPPPAKVEKPSAAPPVTPVAITQPNPASAETNQTPPTPTNPPVAVVPAPPPANTTPATNAPPPLVEAASPSPTTNIAPSPASQTNAPAAIAIAATTAEANPARNLLSVPILAAAAIVLAGAAVLCLALLSRSRKTTRVSLITQSMNKDRK